MKFTTLTIENFLAITSAEIRLDDRGLVLVQGVNKADSSAISNGAGKSSIPDALCWVWFGTTARGLSGDDVINRIAGKNCKVTSVLIDGGITYTASRHRKHKSGKNSLTITAFDGFRTIDLTKGTDKLTQDVAQQIIGASHEVFAGSIYAGQEQMPDLPSMTDKNLKLLIEEASGITALEEAYKKAREEYAAKKALVDGKVLTLNAEQNNLSRLRADKIAVEASQTAWETGQAEKLREIVQQIKDDLLPKIQELDKKIVAESAQDYPSQIAAINAKIDGLSAETDKLQQLEKLLSTSEANVLTIKSRLDLSRTSMMANQNGVDRINHKIGCPCGECGRPITEAEIGQALKAAVKNLETVTEETSKLEVELQKAQETQKKVVEARDSFKGSMTDARTELATRDALMRSQNALDSLRKDRTVASDKILALKQRVIDLKAEISPFKVQIERLETAIADSERSVDVIQKELILIEHDALVTSEAVKVFSPSGVRSRVLDEITPYLNAQTSKYLSVLSDGNIEAIWTTIVTNSKGELKEKFSIDVTNATGGEVFKALSGGEKRKVRISTALALQDLVATRATKPIDIFIGDEIDDALDPAGLERLMVILEEKASERGSVFIISHNELRDMIKNVLTVEKTASGETKITETVI